MGENPIASNKYRLYLDRHAAYYEGELMTEDEFSKFAAHLKVVYGQLWDRLQEASSLQPPNGDLDAWTQIQALERKMAL